MTAQPAKQVNSLIDLRANAKRLQDGIILPSGRTIRVTKQHACENCYFNTRTCGTRGPVDSPFVIVGESPGQNEIDTGQPFSGESGDLLNNVLFKLGYIGKDWPEPYITNAIKCLPSGRKDQASLTAACKSCRGALLKEIASHPRQIILALGNAALWSLTGDFKTKITQVRGNIFPSPYATHGVIASVHPAYLLRGGGSMPKFRSDVALAVEKIQGIARPKYIEGTYSVIANIRKFKKLHRGLVNRAKRLGRPIEVGADIETSGFSSIVDRILCLGIGWSPKKTYVITDRFIQHPQARLALKAFLEESSEYIKFVWHNGKFDIQFFWTIDINARVDEDLMLLSYTLDENKGLHDLEQVSNDAVGAPNWKAMLEQWLPSKKSSYEVIPRPVLYKYLGLDVGSTLQSYHVLSARVRADKNLKTAYEEVMIRRATPLLARMEFSGIHVDLDKNKQNQERLELILKGIQHELDTITTKKFNRTININSPIQVASMIYDNLGIEKVRGSSSTDKDTLESLPPHQEIKLVLKYRKASKALGTYVQNLVDRVDNSKRTPKIKKGHMKPDGRVHATYLIHGTVTGRLSSRNPNLQNIPRDPLLRSQFRAAPGHVLIEVDLNQAELRCLAVLSGDPDLMAIYLDPDHPGLHHEVSVALFGENYTGEDKMRAKAVNFGIVYGRTGASLAEEFGLSGYEGDRWVDGWFKRFPIAGEFIQESRNAPMKGLALVTPFGRKRRFGVVNSQNKQTIGNEASNFEHQSIASDATLVSNAKVIEDPNYRGKPVNIIHDAGLHEVANDLQEIDDHTRMIIRYMEAEPALWGLTRVPFKAEAKIGTHWGLLKEYNPDKHNLEEVLAAATALGQLPLAEIANAKK